ncbi:MAG TPA: glycosyl hydrolase [Pseudonocardiaceae bacterium]|nr:glycosyl hydrolase [Pseudonocardiaceae bacterium]
MRTRPERNSPRFGANYVPSSGWFYSWLDFDPDAVRRDFADLAALGLDHVRIFPIWPWIQPNRGLIRTSAVNDVVTVIDCAAEFGLDVSVDLIQGHLSSFDFLPSWVLTWHQASVFTDATVRSGLVDYARTLAEAVAGRENTFAITLGNEVNNLWPANPTDLADSHGWAAELLDAVRAAAPGLLHVHSLYDDAFYAPKHPFGPADATRLGDITSVHSWVFNGVSDVDGPLGPATRTHADYLVELAQAATETPDRPVWLQEFGAPRPDIPADVAAEFTRGTIESVWHNPALFGITWWCSHDIDRTLRDFPDREYDLGLFTVDHQRKPAAQAIADLIVAGPDVRATRPALLCPVDPAEPGTRDALAPGSPFHRSWVARRSAGPLAIVPPGKAGDAAYLNARGVTLD